MSLLPNYNYVNGDGLDVLDKDKPDGAVEKPAILDNAIRQVKQYLLDTVAGPDALMRLALPIGMVTVWPGDVSDIPTEFLLCDGQVVTSSHPELLSALTAAGNPHSSDSSIRVPNLVRRTPYGADGVASTPDFPTALGKQMGTETATLEKDQLPPHEHLLRFSGGITHLTAGSSDMRALHRTGTMGEQAPSFVFQEATGGDGAHNNTHRIILMHYIIKGKV